MLAFLRLPSVGLRACSTSSLVRQLSTARELVSECESEIASGTLPGRGSNLHTRLTKEVERLRGSNDEIISQVDALKQSRTELVAEGDASIAQIRQGQAHSQASQLVDTLKGVEALDHRIASLRSSQIQNYLDVGALKRQRAAIEKSEEVTKLSNQAYAASEEALPEEEIAKREVEILDTVQRLRQESDAVADAVGVTRKDITNVVSETRSIQLSLRVRRGKADAESDKLRSTLVAKLYEVRRKSAKLTGLRDIQAYNVKLIAVLERARHALRRHSEVQALIATGNKEHMDTEVKVLMRDLDTNQKAAAELEATIAKHAAETLEVTAKLRGLDDEVTPETSSLRERLIAALRQEEFCASRLAILRKVQAQDVKFMAELGKAIAS